VEVRLSLVKINGIAHVLGLCRDITQRKRDEQLRNLMISELDHRVKNNLTSVVSLVEMARSGSEPENSDAFDTLIGRIRAMSRAHEALARHHWRGVDAREVTQTVAGGFAEDQLRVHGDSITIPARAAGPIAMVLHELATNAIKYGALSTTQGRVDLNIHADQQTMRLTWTETGGPAVQPPQSTGQGTLLMRGFIEHELSGSIDLDFQPTGLVCRIEVAFEEVDIDSRTLTDHLIRPASS
jgi:two-component sensor histidine kinase